MQEQECQYQVHQEREKLAVRECLFCRVEITEKDSKIRWVESTGMVNHGFDFPDNDQQEPSESKGHVHVSQHRVRLEYIMMQQAFPEDFPTGTNGLETE